MMPHLRESRHAPGAGRPSPTRGSFSLALRLSLAVAAAILALMVPATTRAMGLGITPGELEFQVRPGGRAAQTLHVINQAAAPAHFEVYAEGESAAWFSIEPGEFVLDAGEVRAVALVVAPPVTTRLRDYEATICVVTLQPDSDLRLGAGIRVQAHINVAVLVLSAMSGTSWPTWAAVAAGIIIVLALARRRRLSRAES